MVEVRALLTKDQAALLMRKMNRLYRANNAHGVMYWNVRTTRLSLSPAPSGLYEGVYSSLSDEVAYEPLKYLLFVTPARQVVQARAARGSVVYDELRKKRVRHIESLQDGGRT